MIKNKKITPYLLIITMLFLIFFIIGVNYGIYINQIDNNAKIKKEILQYDKKRTINYKNHVNENCGISFIFPDEILFEKAKNEFKRYDDLIMSLTCKNNDFSYSDNKEYKKITMTINGVKQDFDIINEENKNGKNYKTIRIYNDISNKIIEVKILNEFIIIFERTLVLF